MSVTVRSPFQARRLLCSLAFALSLLCTATAIAVETSNIGSNGDTKDDDVLVLDTFVVTAQPLPGSGYRPFSRTALSRAISGGSSLELPSIDIEPVIQGVIELQEPDDGSDGGDKNCNKKYKRTSRDRIRSQGAHPDRLRNHRAIRHCLYPLL